MTSLYMWCLVVFQRDLHVQFLPRGKDNLLLKDILCLKRVVYVRVHTHGIARKKHYGVIPKQMNFNWPHRCNQ